MCPEGGDRCLLGNFRRSGLENHGLGFGLLTLLDLNIFFEVGNNDAVELFERRTDALFTAGSCHASHGDFVGVGLHLFGDSQLDHSKRKKRKGGGNNFSHSKLKCGFWNSVFGFSGSSLGQSSSNTFVFQ